MSVCNSFALNQHTKDTFTEQSVFCLPLNNILTPQHSIHGSHNLALICFSAIFSVSNTLILNSLSLIYPHRLVSFGTSHTISASMPLLHKLLKMSFPTHSSSSMKTKHHLSESFPSSLSYETYSLF